MGNSLSSKSENNNNNNNNNINNINYAAMTGGEKKLDEALDYIASYYILTMDFQSLRKLYEKDYCDELVVLTSELVNRYFSDIEISGLANRVQDGSIAGSESEKPEKLLFFKKTDIDKLDPERKRELCNEIAKFYVKIAHLFAAILTTINPEYVYTDSSGKKVKRKLSEKSSIPPGVAIETVKSNLCDGRIDALKGDGKIPLEEAEAEAKAEAEAEAEEITVKPKICSMDIYSQKLDGPKESLDAEPGIPELMELYYDADYDYATGEFKGMTPDTRRRFDEDLKRFYSVFTNGDTPPESVKKFSDIKLKDYSKNKVCEGQNPDFDQEFTSSGSLKYSKNKLFLDYAANLRQMIASVNEKQKQLLETINKMFVYVKDPNDPTKEVIRVNPELTEMLLQDLIAETRSAIVELYLKCETDFVEGVKLYEAIVESQILETAQSQIQTLQSEAEKLYNPVKAQAPLPQPEPVPPLVEYKAE
jgi:hypothetical protein